MALVCTLMTIRRLSGIHEKSGVPPNVSTVMGSSRGGFEEFAGYGSSHISSLCCLPRTLSRICLPSGEKRSCGTFRNCFVENGLGKYCFGSDPGGELIQTPH